MKSDVIGPMGSWWLGACRLAARLVAARLVARLVAGRHRETAPQVGLAARARVPRPHGFITAEVDSSVCFLFVVDDFARDFAVRRAGDPQLVPSIKRAMVLTY